MQFIDNISTLHLDEQTNNTARHHMIYLRRILPFTIISALVLILWPSISNSAPSVSVKTKYYNIKGSSAKGLKQQMRRHGPKGYWASTTWRVHWSSKCKLSVAISYTYPRWSDKKKASPALRNKWDSMLKNLKKHEKRHGLFGINAAKEIEKSHCGKKNHSIVIKWAKQDKIYDRRTDHGRNEGVKL